MEVLIENDFFKQIRITDGVLLNIIKYKSTNRFWNVNPRKDLKKISDCLYISKVDKYDRDKLICSKDDYIIKDYSSPNYFVVKKEDKDKWGYEIKTTGCAFSGSKFTIDKIMNDIKEAIEVELDNN